MGGPLLVEVGALRPLVGITCDVERPTYGQEWLYQGRGYFTAVSTAGGLPVLMPLLPPSAVGDYLERLDGLLLSGGNDLDPVHWGEAPHPGLGRVEPERDLVELALAREAIRREIPVLAICRGMQVLVVAMGGDLWQDIPTQMLGTLLHAQKAPRGYPTHAVRIEPGSVLERLIGPGEHRVNSFHHQAVRSVPPGWRIGATAPDGVIEAIERAAGTMALGVQWHPEAFIDHGHQHRALFTVLIEAAKSRRGQMQHVCDSGRDYKG